MLNNNIVVLNNQRVNIESIEIISNIHFYDKKIITLKTISPIVAYRTENNFFKYFSPSDNEFEDIVNQNIKRKYNSFYGKEFVPEFNIKEIEYSRERIVRFKNTTYKAFLSRFKVETNFETLNIILDSGLSSKGSCGFGMMEVVNEENNLPL